MKAQENPCSDWLGSPCLPQLETTVNNFAKDLCSHSLKIAWFSKISTELWSQTSTQKQKKLSIA